MAYTEVSICNLALAKFGTDRLPSSVSNVADLTLDNQAARYVTIFYEHSRDAILAMQRWNFAECRASLTETDAPDFGYLNAFLLPTDPVCLKVWQINGSEVSDPPREFTIERGKLLTDEDTAEIIYSGKITDPAQYDPLFVEALSVYLASKLCMPLSGSRDQGIELTKEFRAFALGDARKRDASEGRAKRKPAWVTSDLVQARFSGSCDCVTTTTSSSSSSSGGVTADSDEVTADSTEHTADEG